MITDFFKKYKKYKTKYLEMKYIKNNQTGGGNFPPIFKIDHNLTTFRDRTKGYAEFGQSDKELIDKERDTTKQTLKNKNLNIRDNNYHLTSLLGERGTAISTTYIMNIEDAVRNPTVRPFNSSNTIIYLLNCKTHDAIQYCFDNLKSKKVAGWSFANGIGPGGGYLHGMMAQEEDLCRFMPTLYDTLKYDMTRRYPLYYSDYYDRVNAVRQKIPGSRIIDNEEIRWHDIFLYSMDVPLLRKDLNEWYDRAYYADIITFAAVSFSTWSGHSHATEAYKSTNAYMDGVKKSLLAAFVSPIVCSIMHQSQFGVPRDNIVDTIVIGAWGCGAFNNDPKLMAKIVIDIILSYGNNYKKIVIAIPDNPPTNYNAFRNQLNADRLSFAEIKTSSSSGPPITSRGGPSSSRGGPSSSLPEDDDTFEDGLQ
jgi:uncharacterized protein (TIGR02452 family)